MEGEQEGNKRSPRKDRSTIRLGIGLGDLRFGASMRQVKGYLGEPEEIEEFSYASNESDRTTAWYYRTENISAHFDSEDGYRLGNLTVRRKDCTLSGRRFIRKKKERVLDELRLMGFGEPELEDMSSQEKPNYELATYESLSLYLWFDHGALESIQWGFRFEDDKETPIWPEAQSFDEMLKRERTVDRLPRSEMQRGQGN